MTVTIDMATNQTIPAPHCGGCERATQYVPNPRCKDVPDAECDKHATCRGCPADRDEEPPDGDLISFDEGPYLRIGREVGELVTSKQAAYGDSFGKSGAVMATLYPGGIAPEKMDDALTVVRVLDKLFRVATARDALGESPWRDIAGYALLAVGRVERERKN